MTQSLANQILEKNKLYKLSLKHPKDTELKKQYNNRKNSIAKLIKDAKKEYYQNYINENQNSSTSMWKCITTICGKEKSKKPIDLIKLDERNIDNKNEIANAFNTFYSEIGEKLANNIPIVPNFTENLEHVENSIYLTLTTEDEILNTIKQLKPKKSPGEDNIHSETLQKIDVNIAAPLNYIINNCYNTGHFPNIFKNAIIKPLYKSGERSEMGNYRPVSLISNVSKIMEKIMKTRLCSFLKRYNILSDHQYGFSEGKSTEDTIYNLTSIYYLPIDRSKCPRGECLLRLVQGF